MFEFDDKGSYVMPAHFGPRPMHPKASGWYRDVTSMVIPYVTDRDALASKAAAIGIRVAADDTWSDIVSRVLTERIERDLGAPAPTMKSLQEIWDKIGDLETQVTALETQNQSLTNLLLSIGEKTDALP